LPDQKEKIGHLKKGPREGISTMNQRRGSGLNGGLSHERKRGGSSGIGGQEKADERLPYRNPTNNRLEFAKDPENKASGADA